MVSFTNLVLSENETEKKEFQPSRKNSSTIPGSWTVPRTRGMILGPGGVVGDGLSGQKDGCESYEFVLHHHGPAFGIRGWRGAGERRGQIMHFFGREKKKPNSKFLFSPK